MRSSNPRHLRRPASAQAFTLIELMVVIGIIGLLVAIALPALNAARVQAKITATAATIKALDTGLEQFRTDNNVGGAYPPSTPDGVPAMNFLVANPHATTPPTLTMPGSGLPVPGACLLVWALAGADLLGTPGFRDLDGDGAWWNNTGNNFTAPQTNIYAFNAATNKPYYSRSASYVDLTKMTLPKRNGNTFILDKVGNSPLLPSYAFLDSFNQPILYYRANVGKPFAFHDLNRNADAVRHGVYTQFDNRGITGTLGNAGMDLGGGATHYLGWSQAEDDKQRAAAFAGFTPRTFGASLQNRNIVNVGVRAQRDDSFVLISAGYDGIFGSEDDIVNFQINK